MSIVLNYAEDMTPTVTDGMHIRRELWNLSKLNDSPGLVIKFPGVKNAIFL